MDDLSESIGCIVFVILVIAAIIGIGGAFQNYEDTHVPMEQVLEDMGISGEHQIVLVGADSGLTGEISGSGGYFIVLGGGSIEGKFREEYAVTFEWQTPDGLSNIVTVPLSTISWDLAPENVPPTFEFVFERWYMEQIVDVEMEVTNFNDFFNNAPSIIIHTTREQYVRDVLSKIK